MELLGGKRGYLDICYFRYEFISYNKHTSNHPQAVFLAFDILLVSGLGGGGEGQTSFER